MNRTDPRSGRATWTCALLFGLAACAGGAGGSSGDGGSADLITQQQIDESGLDTALEVVRRYRARWLLPARSPTPSGVRPITGRQGMPQDGGDANTAEVYPVVALDGVLRGEIATLSSISARTVASIEFVRASDARSRYGAGYEGGVIELRSR